MSRLPKLKLLAIAQLFAVVNLGYAADPSVQQALAIPPIQPNIDVDRPSEVEGKNCTLRSETNDKSNAWVVYSENGELLRRFIDTNGDNKVDQWCYAKAGIEVYRDIDADFDGKADQYRWLGSAGSRWGLDKDEDGRIDNWKWISAEEASSELIESIKTNDEKRFQAILLTEDEIKSLKLSTDLADKLSKQTNAAKARFKADAIRYALDKSTKWIDFSAPVPGVIAANGKDFQQDLIVYENVIALVETEQGHDEINIGTMIEVDNAWRIIDLPEKEASTGFFFTVSNRNHIASAGQAGSESNPKIQAFVEQLSVLDAKLAKTNIAAEITNLNKDRATILRSLADVSKGRDRELWMLQLVDALNAASQTGNYASGRIELGKLVDEIAQSSSNRELLAQAKYAFLSAEYAADLQQKDVDYAKVQEQWLKNLESFVRDFPQVPQAADAMLQLAIAEEFSGNFTKAINWYQSITSDFANSDLAVKAAGAERRLGSVGKSLRISGTTLDGKQLDVGQFRGDYVLVHYWATWCEPCKEDMKQLRAIQAKYARSRFAIVGVNLDHDRSAAEAHVARERIPWPQIHDSGGLESKTATELGIFTLPIMLLFDRNGTVMNRSITVSELDSVLKKR